VRRYSILLIAGLLLLAACLPAALPQPSARTAVPTWTLPFPASTLTFSPATSVPRRTGAAPKITPTPPPTTPSPSPSPTARPGIDPTLGVSSPDPYTTSYIPIPDPVSQRHLDPAIVNILLVGRDTAMDSKSYRTDVMIVVSINKKTNSATLLTIPRDLYVYIPGYKVERINTAAEHGDLTGYPGGGMALLEQTILYNLGIPIHGWAAVDFSGFKQVVDLLGGVDVPVSCSMSDWRLKDPSLDQQNANNWEMFTVPAGVQHMDGDYALWYARARKHSSDFERSHRQHQVLRAMLDKALQLNMLTKIPQLYATYGKIVETDLGLGDILQFVPLATQIGNASIKSRFIGRTEVFSWTAPDGAMVLLPDRDGISRLLDEAFLPPAVNMLARTAPSVEIWNGTTNADWAALAADNLAWDGLQPVIGKADAQTYAATTLYDYTTSPKGSPRQELERLFHLTDARVVAAPDPNAGHPFRVILGSDFNSCVTPVFALRPTPTPPGGAAPPAANITHAAAIVGQPPPIDGDLKEWTSLPYPINEPIFGQANWHGPSDLSGAWNAAWDDLFLYLAVRVKDDVFVQTATGENLYKGDSLEVWLDIDPGSRTQALTGHDFQLGISPGNLAQPPAKAEMYLWRPTEQARSVTDGHIGALLASDGYTLEVAVPWSAFHVTPFAGEGFAFTLALNDDDTPGTQEQQKQAASLKGAKLTDPTTWGILVLDSPPGP
jgi:LCP family protein required for cell wall assembly